MYFLTPDDSNSNNSKDKNGISVAVIMAWLFSES